MRGRALLRRFLLALLLLLPGTPAIVAQQGAAHAAVATPATPAATVAPVGTPPEDRLHFAALPMPSGAAPAYPLNHSFDGQSQSLGALVPNADFETAGTTVGAPPTNSDFSASSTTVGTPPTNADFESGTLSGWTTTGCPVIASDGSHDAWAKLPSGAAITSAPFIVDAKAQVFSFDLNYVTSGSALSVYLLSGTNYGTSTTLGYLYCGCTGWQTMTFDASIYLGQSVELKFSRSGGTLGIDNVGIVQVLPGYQTKGTFLRSTEGNGNVYARLNSGALTSSPVSVAASAQYLNVHLKGLTHSNATGTLESFAYTLDGAGNRVAVTSTTGTETYTFDLLDRLTEVVYPNGDTVDYSYDAAGNRLSETVNGVATNSSYDDAGELTSAGSTSYSYDANGNLTSAGSASYSWDWHNQLTSATVGGTTASYSYDGAGTRVGATVNGTASSELWDTSGGLPQLVSDGTTSYLQANGLQAAIGASGTSYPLADALGSVRGVTDGSGTLVGTTDYAVFGGVCSQSGTSLAFGYTGQQTDATGLVYLRARELDPTLGRFLSPDTVQPNAPGSQGYYLYACVANNPTTWVDPNGHSASSVAESVAFLGTACLLLSWCRNPLFAAEAQLVAGIEENNLIMPAGGFAASVFALIACALNLECLHLAFTIAAIVQKYGSSGPANIPTGNSPLAGATPMSPSPAPNSDAQQCRAVAAKLQIPKYTEDQIKADHSKNSPPSKDKFSVDWRDIKKLIEETVNRPMATVYIDDDDCVFEFDTGTVIGEAPTGQPETIVRVVVVLNQKRQYAAGSVVTAYPIGYYRKPRS